MPLQKKYIPVHEDKLSPPDQSKYNQNPPVACALNPNKGGYLHKKNNYRGSAPYQGYPHSELPYQIGFPDARKSASCPQTVCSVQVQLPFYLLWLR